MGKEFSCFPCTDNGRDISCLLYKFQTGLKLKRSSDHEGPRYFVDFLYQREFFTISFITTIEDLEFLERAFASKSEFEIFEIYLLDPFFKEKKVHPFEEKFFGVIDDSSDQPIYIRLLVPSSKDLDILNLYLKYPDTAILLNTPDNFYLGRSEDRDWR